MIMLEILSQILKLVLQKVPSQFLTLLLKFKSIILKISQIIQKKINLWMYKIKM